jgi:hypothetical protein
VAEARRESPCVWDAPQSETITVSSAAMATLSIDQQTQTG